MKRSISEYQLYFSLIWNSDFCIFCMSYYRNDGEKKMFILYFVVSISYQNKTNISCIYEVSLERKVSTCKLRILLFFDRRAKPVNFVVLNLITSFWVFGYPVEMDVSSYSIAVYNYLLGAMSNKFNL